jgi:hypothetical protein
LKKSASINFRWALLPGPTALDNATFVRGESTAAVVADPDISARYRAVPLVPWAAGPRDAFVTMTTEMAEGRRVWRASA